MYAPAPFRGQRPEVLAEAVRRIQPATLVTATADGYQASHVPMVLKGGDGAAESLAVFQGPQAYVSPSWYEARRRHGKVVPTWNDVAVHAHGPLEVVDDETWLLAHLDDLTVANEAGREQPWAVSDAPAGFVATLARAIVGLRLHVRRLEGAWKMIQHRSDGDRAGTMAGLAAAPRAGDRAVVAVMRDLEEMRGGPGGQGKPLAPGSVRAI